MKTAVLLAPFPYGSELIMTTVEATVQRGLPEFRIVGLPDRSVRESLVRVKAAIQASGLIFPMGRVTVNIGPAHIPKRGTSFDLAIALAILSAQSGVGARAVASGELTLHGHIVNTRLSDVVAAYANKQNLPWLMQADHPRGRGAVATTLSEAWRYLVNQMWHEYVPRRLTISKPKQYLFDEIQGNAQAKRALLIALAGHHHVLLEGPPGIGKTLLAQSAVELLPRLNTEQEAKLLILEGQMGMHTTRPAYAPPFYAPAHRSGMSSLFGKTNPLTPGLLSLSSHGVLFLDELPHFSSEVLSGLYQPLETGLLTLGQAAYATFPACPVIIAARNLCACGRKGDLTRRCTCTPYQLMQFERRLSGPLLDRFPLTIESSTGEAHESSRLTGSQCAQAIAQVHQQKMTMSLSDKAEELLAKAGQTLKLHFRALAHIRSVAETIAKLADTNRVTEDHIHEAMQYRVRRV